MYYFFAAFNYHKRGHKVPDLDHSSLLRHICSFPSTQHIMSEKVDISGICKTKLLRAMWDVAPDFVARNLGIANPWENPSPDDIGSYIDYYQGRPIKTDISGDSADSWLFDRDSSIPLAKIVAQLRKST